MSTKKWYDENTKKWRYEKEPVSPEVAALRADLAAVAEPRDEAPAGPSPEAGVAEAVRSAEPIAEHPAEPASPPEAARVRELELALARLQAQLDLLVKQAGPAPKAGPKPGPVDVTRLKAHAPNRDPDNPQDPNPCRCQACTPYKVHHWYCSICGRGPFRFEKTDPGPGPVLQPVFRRQLQRYEIVGHYTEADGVEVPVQQWVYWSRYACSAACQVLEQQQGLSSQWELVQRQPGLAPVVQAVSQTVAAAGGPGALDDLATVEAGRARA